MGKRRRWYFGHDSGSNESFTYHNCGCWWSNSSVWCLCYRIVHYFQPVRLCCFSLLLLLLLWCQPLIFRIREFYKVFYQCGYISFGVVVSIIFAWFAWIITNKFRWRTKCIEIQPWARPCKKPLMNSSMKVVFIRFVSFRMNVRSFHGSFENIFLKNPGSQIYCLKLAITAI